MTLNKLMLAGNLTRDPEVRFTPKGMPIAKFGLAINRKWKDATTGESKEDVTFVDVDAFGKTAETIGQHFKKGSQIFIEGRLKLDTWDDKQTGQKRSKLGVVCEAFQFVGGKSDKQSEAPKAKPEKADEPGDAPKAEHDDVPF